MFSDVQASEHCITLMISGPLNHRLLITLEELVNYSILFLLGSATIQSGPEHEVRPCTLCSHVRPGILLTVC